MLMQELKRRDINIFYTDTDSLVLEAKDLPKIQDFMHENDIGKLKIIGYYDVGIFIIDIYYGSSGDM